jgi:hypothetical protein
LLPVLAFVGLTSFFRTFQSGLEDARYANRIACLRAFYLKHEPQLADYFLDVSTDERRLEHVGIPTSRLQKYLSMSGTIAVITSALVGSAVGLLGAVASGHSAWVAFIAGTAAAVAALVLMIRYLDAQIRAAQHAMGLEPKAP